LKPEHIAILRDIVTQRAQASWQEIADELHRRYRWPSTELSKAPDMPGQAAADTIAIPM
jgi:hypothetical protein